MSRLAKCCVKQALVYSVCGVSLLACAEKVQSTATSTQAPLDITSEAAPVESVPATLSSSASLAATSANSVVAGSPAAASVTSATLTSASPGTSSPAHSAAASVSTPNTTAIPDAGTPGGSSCSAPLPLRCSDRLKHSTQDQGRANEWFGYGCSARAEGGREAIYAFEFAHDCDVEVRLTSLSTDLDLFMLTSCSQQSNGKCSSTPLDLQEDEHVEFLHKAGKPSFIVVDGYSSSEGSYTLEVNCACD